MTLVDVIVAVLIVAMILCIGFVEGGNIPAAVACIAVCGACAYFLNKEGGR